MLVSWKQRDFCRILITALAVLALAARAGETPAERRSAPADASTSSNAAPMQAYLRAYEAFNLAEWLRQRELREEAADVYGEAMRAFQKIAQDYPDWQRALVDFRIKHCEEALARLRDEKAPEEMPTARVKGAVSVAPPAEGRNTMRLRRAVQLEKINDLDGARQVYRELLAETPQYLPALQGLARVDLQTGRIDEARQTLAQAVAVAAEDDTTLLLQAILSCHDGNFKAARAAAEKILQRNPWDIHAQIILGAALAQAGQDAAAEEAFKRALSLNPRLSEAYYNLAQLSLRHKPVDLAATKAHYRNALKYGAVPDRTLEALLE